jgi:hypothetical protein
MLRPGKYGIAMPITQGGVWQTAIDKLDIKQGSSIKSAHVKFYPPKDLAPGEYLLQVTAADRMGFVLDDEATFTVTGE